MGLKAWGLCGWAKGTMSEDGSVYRDDQMALQWLLAVVTIPWTVLLRAEHLYCRCVAGLFSELQCALTIFLFLLPAQPLGYYA